MRSRYGQDMSKTGGLYMDSHIRKWLGSVICLMVVVLASANQLFACGDPFCGDCQKWDANVPGCVDDDDQDTTGGDTGIDLDVCGYCQKCSGGACADDDDAGNGDEVCIEPGVECKTCQWGDCEDDDDECEGECKSCSSGVCGDDESKCPGECDSCDDGICVDDESKCPGECDTCDDGICVDDDWECRYNWRLCETCNDGECEDKCPALGKYCDYVTGQCEVCVANFHCELCEQCNALHECVHPCDTCQWPKYCGWACSCVECSEGAEDTTTCSTSNDSTECSCSGIIYPCSGEKETKVYSGNPIKSCTGDDCFTDNVLCYTTYDGCEPFGSYTPLLWCLTSGTGLPTCTINLDIPGPGCYNCVHDTTGFRTNEDTRLCPTEHWP